MQPSSRRSTTPGCSSSTSPRAPASPASPRTTTPPEPGSCSPWTSGEASGQDVHAAEPSHDLLDRVLRGRGRGLDVDLGLLGAFVVRVDASEVRQVAPSGLGVQTLDIALLSDRE